MSDDDRVVAFMRNVLAQYEADLQRKPGLTTQQTYELLVSQLNAYYAEGVFAADYTPDQAFSMVTFVFSTAGYTDLASYANAQEGDGGWASWPIALDATP